VPLLLPTGAVVGVEVALPEPVGRPAIVAAVDADVREDVEASAAPWTDAWKEQPPTLSTARRTAVVRADARVIPER
jgi:hypothetical protein